MNPDRLHLLIVEDEAAHIEAIRRAYEAAGTDAEIHSVGTLREFRACVQENPPDLALADLNLPDGRAVEVLTHPPEDAPFPILVMTAFGNQQIVVEVMKAGALDYVVKSPEAFASMPHTVEGALREWKLLQKHKQTETERRKIAAHEKAILETVPDIITEVDNDQIYTWVNPAGLEFFGDDVVGRKAADFFEGEQETLATVQPLFNGNEQVIYLESFQRRQDGQKRLLAWWCHTLKDPQGRVVGALSTARDITERKQAEEALADSERKYKLLFGCMTSGFALHEIIRDGNGTPCDYRFLQVNPAFEILTGLKADALVGKTVLEVMPRTEPLWIERYGKVATTGEPTAFENFSQELDRHYQVIAYRTEAEHFAVIVNDITGRKQAEEALRQKQEMLARTESMAHVGSWEWEVVTDTVKWSDAMFQIFQRNPADGAPPFAEQAQLYEPEDMARLQTAVEEAIHQGTSYELEIRAIRKDGSTRICLARGHAEMGLGNKVVRLFGFLQDITERKQAENALRASEERYRTILNATPDGVVIIAAEGRTVMVSPAAAKIFGFGPEEDLRGRPIGDFIVPEDQERAFANMALSFQGRLNGPIEYRARRTDGSTFDMEVNAETLRDADGKPIQMVAAIRDITARKQRETYLETSRDILRILNEPEMAQETIQHIIAALKTTTGFDAVGIRLQEGEDFPYFAQQGFSPDFLQTENTLVECGADGRVCRDPDGHVCLECTCGLVLSGNIPSDHPLFTKGGSFWTNDSFPLLELPADQDPRFHPRNQCIHLGYASMALVPIRAENRIVGLIHLNDRRKGCFTPDAIEILETIAAQIGTALLRKQAEKKLRESEIRLSAAQEMARAGHWEYDIASDTFTFNDNFYRIYRTTAEQVGGYQMSSAEYARRFCHPDDRALVGQETRAAIESTDPNYTRQIEHRILYADGTVGHIAVRFSIVKDAQGRTIKTYGVNQDITEHKQAEEALRAAQQITEGILNAIPMRVFWKDANLVFRGCNQAFARDAGFRDPKDLIGKDDRQMSWRAQAELYRADDRQVIRSGQPKLLIEEPQTTPDGKTITLLTSKVPLRDAQGKINGVLGMYLDITDRKLAEEKWRASEARHRDIAANIPGAVYQLTVNRKGFFDVPFMSAGCENLFERPIQSLDYAALWFDQMPPDDLDAFRQSLAAAAKRMEQWTREFRIVLPDGSVKWLRGSANPQKLPSGGILWNGVLLDITERKLAEEKAKQEQALNNAIIESIPGTFYMLDETGKYVRWSAYQRDKIVGKPDDQVAQTNAADTIHPEDRALIQTKIATVLRNGTDEIVEGRVLLRGGPDSRWLLMTGRRMMVDGHPFLVGIGIDISDRKQAEAQMARQLDELRRWQAVTLGRESRVAELKREVNALTVRLGQKPPYGSVEEK
jgi:PAS domain S-box-containing protein